ncbi:MAG: hydrogen gas-evolving membrane-bound hydrogenase subunit E [Actinomycetota bacterium]
MIWLLLGLHVLVVGVLTLGGSALGRRSLLVAAVAPATTTVWALSRLSADEPATASVAWVDRLDLELAFRVNDLGILMTLLVSGIGTLVFVYAFGYFSPTAAATTRFTTTLLSFSTAMLGLVWSDSVWTLFLFWELTSITSFLLVGHKDVDPAVRAAARRALMITVAGGLALMAGLVVLVDATGTGRLSEMGPVTGTSATVAAVLVLAGAATKSAQVPFHMWLPGAMAAPTPVSAYLHSATMVKAGVLLVALASPILSDANGWRTLGLVLGLGSMLWGAIGALRHVDGKLILAWGTISQLGFMIALLSIGSPKATFAGISVLLAHAVFKAALFMVIGEVDVRTGTRRIDELNGLARSMPVAFAVAVASGASMAGVPPLLGFAAKEAAIEAAIKLDGADQLIIGGLIILGSTLTVAYTLRFLIGVFGSGDGPPTDVAALRPAMAGPSAVLGVLSVAGFVFIGAANRLAIDAAAGLDPGAAEFKLYRWPGLTMAFMISAGIVAVGSGLGWVLAGPRARVPAPIGANTVDLLVDRTIHGARKLTARMQHGSLPVYVATMGATAAVASSPFVGAVDLSEIYLWDSPAQGALALLIVVAAVATTLLDTRLAAALALGVVGIGVSGLFAVQGAPDLVLTQLLVETVIVVGFVVGLGHLTRRFPRSQATWRATRVTVSILVAAGVVIGLAATASGPTGQAPIEALTTESVDVGGGNNIVNVILTDMRALDTLGEIVVLAIVATGILALAGSARTTRETTA